ncbi:MAG TPA: hypothetical protein VNT23_05000 [Gaiellaceae bacterium]|nr:hypothetical protein [Gaiellaceae bacterium]
MATKKQRRRREKQHRHEWEEVYVDEEGRELDPEEAQAIVGSDERTSRKAQPEPRSRRPVEPPSLRRTMKRGLLFFPLMLLVVFLIGAEELTTLQKVVQTLMLMLFFLPFSYFMDSLVWRSYQKRLAKQAAEKRK